jgi:hypothetical protein
LKGIITQKAIQGCNSIGGVDHLADFHGKFKDWNNIFPMTDSNLANR